MRFLEFTPDFCHRSRKCGSHHRGSLNPVNFFAGRGLKRCDDPVGLDVTDATATSRTKVGGVVSRLDEAFQDGGSS